MRSASCMRVQYFERARLVQGNKEVTLTPLGTLLTSGRSFPSGHPTSTAGVRWFGATRHTLSGRFLAFWEAHAGGQVLGLPISEPLREQNGDGSGRTYLVQYCQYARLEYHPELAGTPYEASIGLLGRQLLRQRGWP